MTFSIVVVTYPLEYGLLTLQARSINRFVNPDHIQQIIIVDQGDGATNIVPEYGEFSNKVQVIPSDNLTTETCEYGWIRQQLLKLLAIQRVETKYTIILDCKNIFVKPYTPNSTFHLATVSDPMLDECYMKSLTYFDTHADSYPQGVTPFYMHTQSVKHMIEHISEHETDWHHWMMYPANMRYHTEFSLYYAWMVKNHILETYHTLTTDAPRGDGKPVMSVHRDSWKAFSQQQTEDILSYFSELGIVNNLHEGLNLTHSLRLA